MSNHRRRQSKHAKNPFLLLVVGALFLVRQDGIWQNNNVSAFTFWLPSISKISQAPLAHRRSTSSVFATSSDGRTSPSKNNRYPSGSSKPIHDHRNSTQGYYRNSLQPAASLNNELHRLRRRRNGLPLAERRLEEAIGSMLKHQQKDNVTSLIEESAQNSYREASEQILMFPDEVSFNSVISSHAKNAHRDLMAPQRAEQLLRQMQSLSLTFPHLAPTIFTYNAVMEAYGKSASARNNRRSQNHQQTLVRLFREVQETLGLNTYTYDLMLMVKDPSLEEWQQAESWADAFLKGSSRDPVKPDRGTFNFLLATYAQVGDAEKAEALLLELLKQKPLPAQATMEQKKRSLYPNGVWYNLVLKALAASCDICDAVETKEWAGPRADALLEQMKTLHGRGHDGLRPDLVTYNHVMNVHAQCGNTDRAKELILELEDAYEASGGDSDIIPDRITYTTVIKAYAAHQEQVSSPQELLEIAQNAEVVFQTMQELGNAGRSDISPSPITYNTMINIWTSLGTREGMKEATELLRAMQTNKVSPDSFSYATLIHGWSKTLREQARVPEAGYRAEQLLHELEQLPPSRLKQDFSRTIVYNSVMASWAKCGDKTAPQRVDALLTMLENKFFNGQDDARPDKTTFLCMIDAYAKAGLADSAERCDHLLQRMSHLQEVFQFRGLEPDRTLYNCILNALAKSCQPSSVEKAEEILTMMQASPDESLRPDIVTYATVIDCHTKCGGNASERAEELIRFVEGSYRSGDELLKPNAVFYSAILQAWAKTSTVTGATKAEELLRRNMGLYEKGYDYAKPHAIMYNAVMDAIARTGEPGSGARAEELLDEMETLYQSGYDEMKPTRRSFNAVILAYRAHADGGKKPEELLRRMEELADAGHWDVTPDVVSYNCVIGAIVDDEKSAGAADRAQSLLDRMEERLVQPDGRTYSCVIKAWLKRNDEKGHTLAEMMLKQFLEKVESNKQHSKREHFYEDAVWDVINEYRESDGDLASLLLTPR